MSDVTVIGSGIAALAAALEAKSHGSQVTVIRGRPGATALSSGAWDVAGAPTRHARMKWKEHPSPADNLLELVHRTPHHPYAVLSKNDLCRDLPNSISRAMDQISERLSLKLRGSLGQNFFALHPLGGVKATAFVQPSQCRGNLLEMSGARLLVVGLRGLPYFSAPEIAKLLRQIHDHQGHPYLAQITTTELTLKGLPESLSAFEIAKHFDDEALIEALYPLLLQEAEKGRATHIALPPVMGLQKAEHILSRLTEASKLTWFETLGTPPSVPGLRLQQALERALGKSGFQVVAGEAVEAITDQKKVREIKIRTPEGLQTHPVDHLILTTGRYLGGGIIKEKTFRETLLNLPLFAEGRPLPQEEKIFTGKFLSEKFLDNHELFSIGVRTNQDLQPVGERGNLLYENVWAAGSLLGGYNSATQHCGMGVAVLTGTIAGTEAART